MTSKSAGLILNLKVSAICFIVLLLVTACRVRKVDPDEELIRSAREFSNEAIAKHDTASIVSVMTPDFHMITSRNADVSGNHNAALKFSEEFKLRPDVVYTRIPNRIKIFHQWNMASEQGRWIGKWTSNEGLIEISGAYFAKWHLVGKKWLIRAEIFVPSACKGGSFCEQSPI